MVACCRRKRQCCGRGGVGIGGDDVVGWDVVEEAGDVDVVGGEVVGGVRSRRRVFARLTNKIWKFVRTFGQLRTVFFVVH